MANIANDLTITSLETITGFDITTGNFLFTLDELQNATISHTQEKEDITGKQGRKLNSLKKNKGVTVSGTNGMISGGLLELQVGGTLVPKLKRSMLNPQRELLALLLSRTLPLPLVSLRMTPPARL